jgi:glyoxylate/hydroxypyruvate reductase
MSVGYDHIDIAECRRRDILVGNTPNVLTDATADLTITLLLSLARRIPESFQAVLDGNWGNWSPTW